MFVRIPPTQLKLPVMHIFEALKYPCGIAISDYNKEVLFAEKKGGQVSVFDKQGRKLKVIQHMEIPHPKGVATDPDGHIYICNEQNNIVKFSQDGLPLKINNSLVGHFNLMQVIGDALFICSDHVVHILACDDLQLIGQFGKQGTEEGEFQHPYQVLSLDREVYVSDCDNCRI